MAILKTPRSIICVQFDSFPEMQNSMADQMAVYILPNGVSYIS